MIVEKAYAKINLVLNTLYKREDGYHEVEMLMTTLELHDIITIKKSDEIKVTTNKFFLPNNSNNLAYKAAEILKETYNIKEGAYIHIEKNIPVSAGLAGGSADAAATLRALNKLWNINVSLDVLADIGAKIGSDVPFCIYNKTAIATGRGEILNFISSPPNIKILLVKPKIGVSTKEIYDNLNLDKITNHNIQKMISAIENSDIDKIQENLYNSLESVTLELYPEVKEIKDNLIKYGAKGVLMSGSGPTVYAMFIREKNLIRTLGNFDKKRYEIYSTWVKK